MSKEKEISKTCLTCSNCVPIGEGDHVCIENQVIVLEDYTPTDDYCYCNECDWEEL